MSETSVVEIAPESVQATGIRKDPGLRTTLITVTVLMIAVGIAVVAGLTFYSPASAAHVNVSESDYGIRVPTTLRAGRYNLTLTNNGVQPHELLIFRTDLPANALPVDASGDVIEDSPQLHSALDSGAGLGSHKTQALSVTLQPGHYVAVCNLPTHYRLGMRVDITVGK
jgi:Sulfocyanin (SoxE) domain